MAVKIIDNISIVQAVPAVTSETFRDVSKPLSFYLVGVGSNPSWSATVTFYEIDNVGYKKVTKSASFTVSNLNKAELYTWTTSATSFVAHVSSISNASVTVYMTQADSSALERILLTEPSSGTKAMPSDVVNCTAEYVTGQGWIGNLGVLDSKAVLDSFPTNALVPGKVWAVVASASSFAKYNYMSAGWALESSVGPTGNSNLPGSPSNPFTSTAERDAWAAENQGELLAGMTKVWGPGNAEYVWLGSGPKDWRRTSDNKLGVTSQSLQIAGLSYALTKTSVDTRKAHDIPSGTSFLQFEWRNGGPDGSSAGEFTGLSAIGDVTLTAYLEIDGGYFPLLFGGKKTVTVSPGCFVRNDPVSIGERSARFVAYTRTHIDIAGGLKFIGTNLLSRSYEGVVYNGPDIGAGTGISGYTASTTDMGFAPCLMLTDSKSRRVLAVSDSIGWGVGESGGLVQDPYPPVISWIRRASVANGFSVYVAGYPGATCYRFKDITRMPALATELGMTNFTTCVFAFGANDCLTDPFASVKANMLEVFKRLRSLGVAEIKAALVLPRTTSTDGWTTTVNQTPVSAGFTTGGCRDQINAWFLSGADGYVDGVLDTLSLTASGQVWLPGQTGDGIHPNGTGHANIALSAGANI